MSGSVQAQPDLSGSVGKFDQVGSEPGETTFYEKYQKCSAGHLEFASKGRQSNFSGYAFHT